MLAVEKINECLKRSRAVSPTDTVEEVMCSQSPSEGGDYLFAVVRVKSGSHVLVWENHAAVAADLADLTLHKGAAEGGLLNSHEHTLLKLKHRG